MYILNFDELFAKGKLDKNNYIFCTKEEALKLLKYELMPMGESEQGFVFIKDELIQILLEGGGKVVT